VKLEIHSWMVVLLLKLAKYIIVPAGVGGGWLARRWMLARSARWPIVPGTVQSVRPPEKDQGGLCSLAYSYVVEGEYYSGEVLITKGKAFRTMEDVQMLLPAGTGIEVRYSPNDCAVSVALLPEMIVSGGFVRRA